MNTAFLFSKSSISQENRRSRDLYGVDATLFIVALLPLLTFPFLLTKPFREAKD